MTLPSAIRAALVSKLRAISALVDITGSTNRIVEHTGHDLFAAIVNLRINEILVVYRGSDLSGEYGIRTHRFSILFKAASDESAIYDAIVDGTPSGGDGQRMQFTTVTSGVHSMDPATMSMQSIPVSERSSFDYWSIDTAFSELKP